MKVPTISPEESIILDKVIADHKTEVAYIDPQKAKDLTLHLLLWAIENNLPTLLLTADPDELYFTLESYGLKDLCRIIDNSEIINQEDINNWNDIKSSRSQEIDPVDLLSKHYRLRSLRKEIAHGYERLNAPIFGKRKWKHIIDLYYLAQKKANYQILHSDLQHFDFTFEYDRFWSLRDSIEASKILYKKHFDSLESQEIFTEPTLNSTRLDDLRISLGELKSEALALSSKYRETEDYLRERFKKQFESEYRKIKTALRKLKSALFIYKCQSAQLYELKGRSLKKKSKENWEEFRSETKVYLDFLNNSTLLDAYDQKSLTDVSLIEKQIDIWNAELSDWKNRSRIKANSEIKSLSKLSAENADLANLDKELSTLCQKVDDSEIFSYSFENNSLSFQKQNQYIKDLASYLDQALLRLDTHLDYYQWKTFISKQDLPAQQVLLALRRSDPMHWVALFESWYLYNLVDSYYNPDIIQSEALFSKLEKVSSICYDAMLHKHYHVVGQTTKEGLVELKSNQKSLHSALLDKRQKTPTLWIDLLRTQPQFCIANFPIIICNTAHIEGLDLSPWKFVITVDQPIKKSIDARICNIYPYEKEKAELYQNKLLLSKYLFTDKIAELPVVQRLKAAKKLAQSILFVNQNICIYQLRYANVISLLNPSYNDKIYQLLESDGAKEIVLDQDLFNRLTEALLETGRSQIILHQNGILNDDQPESFEWQRSVIYNLKSSGFDCINLWSCDIWESQEETISQMLKKIKAHSEVVQKQGIIKP